MIISDHPFIFDFTMFGMHSFDIIIGINWLSHFHEVIDCERQWVMMLTATGDRVYYQKESFILSSYVHKAQSSLACMLTNLSFSDDVDSNLESASLFVICEFLDNFPNKLYRLPLE